MLRVLLALAIFASPVALAQSRVAILHIDGFPTVDAPVIAQSTLDDALRGLPVERLSTLADLSRCQTLVLPYGSAFPLDAWTHIRTFVARGGNLVVLGGAPFHQPVLQGNVLGTRRPTWARELLIGPVDEVHVPDDATVATPQSFWTMRIDGARTVYALTLRLARQADMSDEQGSEGPREAVVRPLVHVVHGGLPRATPLIEIDRIRGPEAGARWIFAPSDAPLNANVIRAIVERAMRGSSHLEARPVHATIDATEKPSIIIDRAGTLTVTDDRGRRVHEQRAIEGTNELRIAKRLAPGLYHVEVTAADDLRTTTGFWVRDDALLKNGPKLTVSRDWFRVDGAVLPVVGTTYMSSTVHRQFLFEPNPHVWDRDFASMKSLGINFVRTGLWTAWSRAVDAQGTPNESFLRALDAYVLTAAKHRIFVNFTFYAFLPLAHGGTNPYLDPQSLAGQRRFLSTVAARYRGVSWIHYDLINEPSYAPPNGLWSNRPIRDAHERDVWASWVRKRHGDDADTELRDNASPRTSREFIEFTNEMVAQWAGTLRGYLREAGGGDVLVTLGQDEGGTHHRPSQQLHAHAIDYTCIHPWWQNDDVLANGVSVKVPEKPSLFQETGIMRLENIDGWHWRTPEIAASLLNRKFASAFAARAAGNVQWAWNINPYMPIDNESVIGFFRADGTAKPEIAVVPSHAEFFRTAAPWLDDFEPDSVVIVLPQSRLFTNRPAAVDGYRRAMRIMAERFGVVPTAISDLRLTKERLRYAKLVIVPSVEFLGPNAEAALSGARRTGTKVLTIGVANSDTDPGRPVVFHEDGATFDRNLQESLLRSTLPRSEWHEPLPVEHARESEPLVRLLERAFAAAEVETHPSDNGVAARLLYAPRSIFGVFINDTAHDAPRRVTIAGNPVDVNVPAGGSRLMLWERSTGKLIAQSR